MSEQNPKTREQFEIEKLQEEIRELRSWVRRCLGGLGGILGIAATVFSLYIAYSSRSEADIDRKLAEVKKTEATVEARFAERSKANALQARDEARKNAANAQNAQTEAEKQLFAARLEVTNQLLVVETAREEADGLGLELAKRRETLEMWQAQARNFPPAFTSEQKHAVAIYFTNLWIALAEPGDRVPEIVENYRETAGLSANSLPENNTSSNQVTDISLLPTSSSNTPPTIQTISFLQDVSMFGGWKRIRGDGDMDTDRGDIVPVTATTLLTNDSKKIWLEVFFSCKEFRGDKTEFSSKRSRVLVEAKDGRSIGPVHYVGTNFLSFKASSSRDQAHGWRTFAASQFDNSYWTRFGYVIDTPARDDSKYVGVLGRISFVYELK